MISLTLYYWGDWFTVSHAKSTPESICYILFGFILALGAMYFMRKISNARFYSGFFECNLDGTIDFQELSDVTGKKALFIMLEFASIMHLFMKRYRLEADNGRKYIKLCSKSYNCYCKHCGAVIEKEVFFTGKCSYCGGSNLYAAIITDNKFYSIKNDIEKANNNVIYYQKKNLDKKRYMALIISAVSVSIIIIMFLYMCDTLNNIIHYEEYIKDYYHQVLFEGKEMLNYGDIKRESLISDVVFTVGFMLCLGVITALWVDIAVYSSLADKLVKHIIKCKRPFLESNQLANKLKINKPFKKVSGLIRKGYIKNCTFEKHDKDIKFALAKKVEKDICPKCGAPIIGAVDDKYVCNYCNESIMGVITARNSKI